jgi:VanZ family protein
MLIKNLLAPNKRDIWLAVFWTFLILFLSLKAPSGESNFYFPNADKVVHFTFYFVFVFLWFKYLFFIQKNKMKNKVALVVVAILFGISMELFQHFFTTTRRADIWDVAANSLGSIMGIIVVSSVFKMKKIK